MRKVNNKGKYSCFKLDEVSRYFVASLTLYLKYCFGVAKCLNLKSDLIFYPLSKIPFLNG